MGTNYYVKTNKCETCGHKPDEIHLGKSSFGWQFSFQYNGGKYYQNVRQMKAWLKDKKIKDEYGGEISHEDFWKMIKEKQTPKNKNHARYCHEKHPYLTDQYIINGYSFSDGEFS